MARLFLSPGRPSSPKRMRRNPDIWRSTSWYQDHKLSALVCPAGQFYLNWKNMESHWRILRRERGYDSICILMGTELICIQESQLHVDGMVHQSPLPGSLLVQHQGWAALKSSPWLTHSQSHFSGWGYPLKEGALPYFAQWHPWANCSPSCYILEKTRQGAEWTKAVAMGLERRGQVHIGLVEFDVLMCVKPFKRYPDVTGN